MHLFSFGSSDEIVSPVLLVRSNEFWDIDGWSGLKLVHKWAELLLQAPVQNLSALHGSTQIQRRDIPACTHTVYISSQIMSDLY